jgi:hypothetical protein
MISAAMISTIAMLREVCDSLVPTRLAITVALPSTVSAGAFSRLAVAALSWRCNSASWLLSRSAF